MARRKSSSFTHPDDDVTPTRDETIESRIQAEENFRERLSSSEAIQETKIKSRWGGDTSDEDEDNQSKNQVQKQETVQEDPDILKDLYPESGDDMIEVDQSGRLGPCSKLFIRYYFTKDRIVFQLKTHIRILSSCSSRLSSGR